MDNDNFFVWKRFCAYFIKTLKEKMKSNLIMAALMFAAMLITVMRTSYLAYFEYTDSTEGVKTIGYDPMIDTEFGIFTLFLFVCGCLWASQLMRGLKTKASRIFVLTTPVTPFEAWLTRWIIHVPLFILVFLVSMYSSDLIRVAVFSPLVKMCPVKTLSWSWNFGYSIYVLFYLLTSSLYALGSTFFPRRPILMTTLVLFFIALIVGYVALTTLIIDNSLFNQTTSNALQAYMGVSVIFFWWLSYKRYKELEIID